MPNRDRTRASLPVAIPELSVAVAALALLAGALGVLAYRLHIAAAVNAGLARRHAAARPVRHLELVRAA